MTESRRQMKTRVNRSVKKKDPCLALISVGVFVNLCILGVLIGYGYLFFRTNDEITTNHEELIGMKSDLKKLSDKKNK